MAFLLFSCSLRDGSRSQVMVEALQTELEGAGHEVEYLDLREAGLPLCDGDDCYDHPATKALRASVAAADGIIFAVQSTISTPVQPPRMLSSWAAPRSRARWSASSVPLVDATATCR